MKALYSVAEIRHIEQLASAALAPGTLMQRAGQAAADLALALLDGRAGGVLVLAGPGNNGGDALAMAARLQVAGVAMALVHLAGSAAPSPETAQALEQARASGVRFIEGDAVPADVAQYTLLVDGLFGIGLARPLSGKAAALVAALAGFGGEILALDVPSGLDADTGALVGPEGVALRATHTLTFIGDKPGLHTAQGRDHAGTVHVASLGIDGALLPPASAQLSSLALFAGQLAPRAHASHKGSFGDVAIVGGARGMAGAPVLSARAALYSGAGRVFVLALEPAIVYDSAQPEIMFRDGATEDSSGTTVAGPGMGDSPLALRLLARAIDSAAPLVLDADALNLAAANPGLQARLAARGAPTILTPHPLEAARLLGVTAAVIQADRLAAARELAARCGAIVVLKGSGTVIARPGGELAINPTGNPGLASAGTGDVLAGICGSLLAQGWPAWEAALAAVWLHGAAADRLVAQGIGPVGLSASELPPAVRALLNELIGNLHKAAR